MTFMLYSRAFKQTRPPLQINCSHHSTAGRGKGILLNAQTYNKRNCTKFLHTIPFILHTKQGSCGHYFLIFSMTQLRLIQPYNLGFIVWLSLLICVSFQEPRTAQETGESVKKRLGLALTT